jgi:class 3 adenylate cyclase
LSFLSYTRANTALRGAIWEQLIAIRDTKKSDILRYLDGQERIFAVFAAQGQLPAAFAAFRAGFDAEKGTLADKESRALAEYYQAEVIKRMPQTDAPLKLADLMPAAAGASLQHRYMVANPNPVGKKLLLDVPDESAPSGTARSAYDQAHQRFHGLFARMMNTMQMYDLFLIDDRTGQILYTVQKEPDFATNLQTGPYRESVLAKAFRAVRDAPAAAKGVVFVDFEAYAASYGAPSAFLAAPVYEGGQRVGIVAGQVSIDALNAALTSSGNWANEGLGKTGEVYLVGRDGKARTDSRFLVEDRKGYLDSLEHLGVPKDVRLAIESSGHNILNQKYETDAVEQAIAGETGSAALHDYRGVDVLSAYAPLDFGGHRWAIIAEKDVAEALGPLHELRQVILLATGGIAVLITVFALLSARTFVRPLMRLQEGVERLKSGETQFRVAVKGDDEFANLGTAFNGMLSEMVRRNTVIEAKTAQYEKLLRNVLPDQVADRFNGGEIMVAETFKDVSIVYGVLGGLDQVQRNTTAGGTIQIMNELIDLFDDAAERHGVEKVKTIGDAYLAACGLSTPRLDHRQRAAAFAEDLLVAVRRFNEAKGLALTLRIGLTQGEVDAGIVGRKRFVYEILGECVSEARRLALTKVEPGLQMSEAMALALLPAPKPGAAP